MASTFTSNTGIEKIGDGQQSGLWGQTTNNNFDIVDRALNGVVPINLVSTSYTLTTAAGGLSEGQAAAVIFTGSLGSAGTITVSPNNAQKTYIVSNQTNQDLIITQGDGGDVTVKSGTSTIVMCTGEGGSSAVLEAFPPGETANLPDTLVQRDSSGNFAAGTITANLTGNASTATALATARTIGGVSFDGTANINLPGVNQVGNQNTTGSAASLTNPRTITVGATGKTFNGTANVSWNLSEIGAAPTVHTHAASDVTSGVFNTARLASGAATSGTFLRGDSTWSSEGNFTTLISSSDATINNVVVGLGSGSVSSNTTLGSGGTLGSNTTGVENTAIGVNALSSNTTGDRNVAIGVDVLSSSVLNNRNVAIGKSVLTNTNSANTSQARDNVGIGFNVLPDNTTGDNNTAVGQAALFQNTTGRTNSAFGTFALSGCTVGENNTGIGRGAGGSLSPFNLTTQSNRVVVGDNNVTNAYIRVSWTVTSDERDKTDFEPLQHGLETVSAIETYTFRFDNRSNYYVCDEYQNIVDKGVPDGSKKSDRIFVGFSAQQVRSVLEDAGFPPDVVVDSEDPENLKMKETALIPILINAIKELKTRVEALENSGGAPE